MMDLATRVYNHTWKIDPIVRSLIDTDFYKLLMCQSVFRNKPDAQVTFQLINRSHNIRLAELIDEGELREQLDHVRGLRLTRGESTWMRGNTFYGKRQMFSPAFMEWFEGLRLPPYHLEKQDGQFVLTFEGAWPEVMLWEIPALAIIMELRSRAVLKSMGRFELQVLYARAMTRVWEKGERLKRIPGLRLADFGTRRRHGYLWQDWCVQAMIEALGPKFVGTSNCLIAKKRDLEAIGTNAHELPMVYAALADSDDQLRQAPYKVLEEWQEEHDGNLLVILPDTYGTRNFLENAPDWLAEWTGIRIDSGDPVENESLHARFAGRVRLTYGWGTLLTNDFSGLVEGDALAPFSLVCKAVEANGRPTVKLSDNPEKAMGPKDQVERYKRVFGVGEQVRREVRV
jgi:nicotinate phosphoribosyltransferase